MKALLLHEPNTWREMKIEEIEKPVAKRGEVVVKVEAASLNPVDYKTATNGNPSWTYPHIVGLDVAGTVEEVGEDVTEWQKGDRVVYHGDFNKKGGYAEYGVGGFGIQLAKAAGKTVISTASAHNHEYVKSLGADHVIDYREEDVKARVMEITNGRGVDAVLDTVSRDNATASLDMIAYNGHIAHIAGAPDYTKVNPFTKVISFHEVALNAIHHNHDEIAERDLAKMGDEFLQLVQEKKVSALVERVISLSEVPQALAELSERHVRGKIVVDMNK
ncbi:zinc-binding dehydrogenase [Priestia flexa]|uniref:zinc-binding dehydrogenase n=1 Tax=Priestia flexa TaxID=86664 RepID=UPI00099CBD75|nr:zinc-binding dehydrogenase [Priestia flexa]AQX54400.1 zinc-binding alcohol dehydrogenase [Priestia flexa]